MNFRAMMGGVSPQKPETTLVISREEIPPQTHSLESQEKIRSLYSRRKAVEWMLEHRTGENKEAYQLEQATLIEQIIQEG